MKIQSYENDNNISLEDKVTGSDADDSNKTKNYTFKNIVAFLKGQGLGGGVSTSYSPPYKVYTANLYQSGTGAPVAVVFENTLGTNITWTRDFAGAYTGTPSNPNTFVFAKTCVILTYADNRTHVLDYYLGNYVQLSVIRKSDDTYVDDFIRESRNTVEIRVYN
jgi:hypothetical protein